MDRLPRLGKRELICLLLFTCNYVVSVWRGFLFLWVPGMGYVILLWHSLSLPYNYFTAQFLTLPHNIEIFGPPQKYETVNGTIAFYRMVLRFCGFSLVCRKVQSALPVWIHYMKYDCSNL